MSGKEEAQILMNEMLPFAQKMLREHGEFHPFGGYVKPNGDIVHAGASIEGNESPSAKDLIETLNGSLRKMATEEACKATAVVFSVNITPPGSVSRSDAIQVNLDHQDGFSAEVFFPCKMNESGEIEFGETFAQEGLKEIFQERSS